MLKGLTDAAKKFITRLLSANFLLPTEASHYEGKPAGGYWDKPIKEDSHTAEHNANLKKKMELAGCARELGKKMFNKREAAELLGISRATVAKYPKEDFNPASPQYNTSRPGRIKPYAEEIKAMPCGRQTFRQISTAIRQKGYDGPDSTIRMFATRERKILKDATVQGMTGEKIERKWLASLLYRPIVIIFHRFFLFFPVSHAPSRGE